MNRIIIFTALYLSMITAAFAGGTATITVHVTDKNLLKQSLTLVLLKEYLHGDVGAVETNLHADQNGYFRFKIADITRFKLFHLQFDRFRIMSNIIESGDQLNIEFSGNEESFVKAYCYQFSGRGSTKMELWSKLRFERPRTVLNLYPIQPDDQSKLALLLSRADSIYAHKLKIVQSFKGKVSDNYYQYTLAESFGATYSELFSFFIINKEFKLDSSKVSDLIDGAEKKRPKLNPDVISESEEYLKYLHLRSSSYVKYTYNTNRDKGFEATYEDLIDRNTGLLREKVLLFFIAKDTRYRYSNNKNQVYHNALRFMADKQHRQFIEEIALRRKTGSKAFDFSMSTVNGNTVHLQNFRNKVVMVECWFLGCESCIELAKKIKKTVLPAFINNDEVVFLTINVDRPKQSWLTGLKRGDYTNSKSINLWTDGLGTNHPFLLHYQYHAMPQLMLIDRKGNVVSTDIRGTGEEIVDKIRKALQ